MIIQNDQTQSINLQIKSEAENLPCKVSSTIWGLIPIKKKIDRFKKEKKNFSIW